MNVTYFIVSLKFVDVAKMYIKHTANQKYKFRYYNQSASGAGGIGIIMGNNSRRILVEKLN